MTKYLLAALCGIALAGSVYTLAAPTPSATPAKAAEECPMCNAAATVLLDATTTAPATAPSAKTDMKNTKCIVTDDDVGDSTKTVEYQGKVYHICCGDCVADFNKNPQKYVKAFDADPSKFGVKK